MSTRRWLTLWAVGLVGTGTVFALAGWDRTTTIWLLVVGLIFAIALLLANAFGGDEEP